ncbi:hydroxyacylglutathione hydrolase [Acuticoccus mangrovi]|uniref:Hydroxyacylglutathione hydrolase n=1 Tax=Acuticoccus mangrovi TaxID=2796142 RepID=A0A934ME77_9HYPH|nr:hydroxyacylglutathione hydrolase [Acuticoccus mangrovi]MBJ3777192.1 hydroxyacylglutathione hydrolase [Acuticoccus mangrovi]
MAEIRLIPCLSDNYAVLVHEGDETVLVDAPEAGPIKAALAETGWTLTTILITHHHSDHVQAIAAVKGDAKVIGPADEADRIAGLDETLKDGADFMVGPFHVIAMSTPGHTSGPLSYYFPDQGIAFTADTLFAMGCGRLFEGDPATMWSSFKKLRAALPDDTRIYCGHEYTLTNARYGHQALPDDAAISERLKVVEAAREKLEPTVPTTMAAEKATNPFMRADDPAVAAMLGMAGADPVDVFAHLRKGRDSF